MTQSLRMRLIELSPTFGPFFVVTVQSPIQKSKARCGASAQGWRMRSFWARMDLEARGGAERIEDLVVEFGAERNSVRHRKFELGEGRFVVLQDHVGAGAAVGEEGCRYAVLLCQIVVGEGGVIVVGEIGDIATLDPCGSACGVFFEVGIEGRGGGREVVRVDLFLSQIEFRGLGQYKMACCQCGSHYNDVDDEVDSAGRSDFSEHLPLLQVSRES